MLYKILKRNCKKYKQTQNIQKYYKQIQFEKIQQNTDKTNTKIIQKIIQNNHTKNTKKTTIYNTK